ncbi:phosphatases II [Saccharata proteae CBS 121410]|uniref:phosphatidylinositol-3,4,5-trisphosphate 3-phosphatase n=1 Tax=Saccharata proteae CBS 121410 TaxID=1314787 RepID=A0A6A5YDF6_9PEZI|nr:phosphatases II [Saccharata proteae CBS 121410]
MIASLLRQIVAGPRARHPDANLDLCYVTPHLIATSGPSGTYPQRAYRNPLSSLVKFLDRQHGDNWAIWEFRAEGTGYPDGEVYGRIWHFPWPDHHPPPFALVPRIVASMRDWRKGGDMKGRVAEGEGKGEEEKRVLVVHCKAGKGRSGTVSCAYLMSEEGWSLEDALKRFTETRMRPGFGAGVSIPSQLRWLGYVDRWVKGGKVYVERQVEVLEVHVWGLRDGVKVSVEGFVDEGKIIKTFHTFKKSEREVVRGTVNENGSSSSGFADAVAEVMGRNSGSKAPKSSKTLASTTTTTDSPKTSAEDSSDTTTKSNTTTGGDVIFRPSSRVVLPTNDVNIDFERRNGALYGYTMVTSVAHVWLNAFFEGGGPEQNGQATESGVFELEWDKMDGIKGSLRKGTRAFDRFAVVWRVVDGEVGTGVGGEGKPVVITEPGEAEEVRQAEPADWRQRELKKEGKDLGLRTESPATGSSESSPSVSKANSVRVSRKGAAEGAAGTAGGESHEVDGTASDMELVKSPEAKSPVEGVVKGKEHVSTGDLPEGLPEGELKTAKGHTLGHVKLKKNSETSS